MPHHDRRLDPIREAACLAHTVPGVSIRLPLTNGEHLLVSHVCLGADLDPCQLRSALIVDRRHGLRFLTDTIIGAEMMHGLVDLGGGVYQRTGSGHSERWFTTSLDPETFASTVRQLPDDDEFDLVITPDSALGCSAVCVRGHAEGSTLELDDAAMRVLSTCVVAELLADLDGVRA